jgi:hypothetical protein
MHGSGSGGDGNGERNLFLKNCVKGSKRKFDGGAKKVGGLRVVCMPALSAHFVCLPSLLPAYFEEQVGKSWSFHNHLCDPRDSSRRRPGVI